MLMNVTLYLPRHASLDVAIHQAHTCVVVPLDTQLTVMDELVLMWMNATQLLQANQFVRRRVSTRKEALNANVIQDTGNTKTVALVSIQL
jgi:hypothetical protein